MTLVPMSAAPWTRELVELATLLTAVAAADLLTGGTLTVAAVTAATSALALALCAAAHHRTHRRRRTTPPARHDQVPIEPDRSHPRHAEPTGPRGPSRDAGPGVLWRVRATVRDAPGGLAGLTASLAHHGVNILSVQVHPVPGGVVDEFLVETRLPCPAIGAAVRAGGGWDVSVAAADRHDLVDVPTSVLAAVARDVAAGADLTRATRALLGDCVSRWDAHGAPTEGPAGTTMRLADPEGGVLTVTRDGPAFTPAEYARLHALLRLDAEFARWLRAQRSVVVCVPGAELTVRQATSADVPALVAMHERCGAESRRSRYLGGHAGTAELTRLVNRRHGRTLVAEHAGRDIVAMGNLMRDGDDADEVALLVEDAWQRRGIGTALLRGLLSAPGDGRRAVAVTASDNTAMLALLHRAGAERTVVTQGATHLTVRRGATG